MIKCLLQSLLHPLQREETEEWTPGAHPEFLVRWYKMARMLQNHQSVSMHNFACWLLHCLLSASKWESMAAEGAPSGGSSTKSAHIEVKGKKYTQNTFQTRRKLEKGKIALTLAIQNLQKNMDVIMNKSLFINN